MLLKNYKNTVPSLWKNKITKVAPWTKIKPMIIDITDISKTENSYSIDRIIEEELDKYNAIHIYTDGSKSNNNVGFTVITPNIQISGKLPSEFSVFSSELYAIKKALEFIKYEIGESFVILTDSMSAISSITSNYYDNELVKEIIEELNSIKLLGKLVWLCWIPGHKKVNGNELADIKAKEASKSMVLAKFHLFEKTTCHALKNTLYKKTTQIGS